MDGCAVATLLGEPALAVRQRLDAMAIALLPAEPEPEPEPEQRQSLSAGQRVEIHGLTGEPELNGGTGVVQRYDEAKGRYAVRLLGDGDASLQRTLAVKPQNLSALSDSPGGAATTGVETSAPTQKSSKAPAPVVEKAYSDAIYLSLLEHGLSVCLKPPGRAASSVREPQSQSQVQLQWVCTEIYLYNEGVDGYRQYRTTALPHNLTWDKTNGEIVGDWGEPTAKSGGAGTPICLEYASKGLELSFAARNWEDPTSPLAFVTLFEPE